MWKTQNSTLKTKVNNLEKKMSKATTSVHNKDTPKVSDDFKNK